MIQQKVPEQSFFSAKRQQKNDLLLSKCDGLFRRKRRCQIVFLSMVENEIFKTDFHQLLW